MQRYMITDGKRFFHTSTDVWSRFECGMCVAKGDEELCSYLKSHLENGDVCGNKTMVWKQDFPKVILRTIVTTECPNCDGEGTKECHMQDYPCHFCDNGKTQYCLVGKQKKAKKTKK